MQHTWGIRHEENLKGVYHLGDLDVDGKAILKYTLKAIWHEELFSFGYLTTLSVSKLCSVGWYDE
jgi:hypothetical protein